MLPNAYLQLGYLYEFNNQHKLAIESIKKVLEFDKYDNQRALSQEANNALNNFRKK